MLNGSISVQHLTKPICKVLNNMIINTHGYRARCAALRCIVVLNRQNAWQKSTETAGDHAAYSECKQQHRQQGLADLQAMTLLSELGYFFSAVTKDEHVVLPNLLSNLYIGAIHGANDEAAIHHELHISCA